MCLAHEQDAEQAGYERTSDYGLRSMDYGLSDHRGHQRIFCHMTVCFRIYVMALSVFFCNAFDPYVTATIVAGTCIVRAEIHSNKNGLQVKKSCNENSSGFSNILKGLSDAYRRKLETQALSWFL